MDIIRNICQTFFHFFSLSNTCQLKINEKHVLKSLDILTFRDVKKNTDRNHYRY